MHNNKTLDGAGTARHRASRLKPREIEAINVDVEGSKNDDERKNELQRPPMFAKKKGVLSTGKVLSLMVGKSADGKKPSLSLLTIRLILFYINHSLLLMLFFIISIYKNVQFLYHKMVLKFLTLAYYPNKSPQLIREDVTKLNKIPKRISCILDLKDDDDENGGIDGLINNISELCAWTLSSGIPSLTIYEYTGSIKAHVPELMRYISKNLSIYFGTDSTPVFSIKVPHSNLIVYSNSINKGPGTSVPSHVDLEVVLLSRIDGKPTIVELTKTMSELAVNKELQINEITVDLIDEELVELVGPEPDLLIYFGSALDLQDYPPWHIRLSEIYWEPDNKDVSYAVYIRALKMYSTCKMNVGK